MRNLNRKFSGFLLVGLILLAITGTAKNRWQSRMEKEPQSNRPSETAVSSTPTDTVVSGDAANCMNVKLRLTTNILSEAGTVSEVPVEELKNGVSKQFNCTSFTPALHGDGQPVTAGTVTALCANGVLKVTSASCALKPKDCGPQSIEIPLNGGTMPTGAIAHLGTANYSCTTVSPALVMDGKTVDRGDIGVKCDNGTATYTGNTCGVPPPCPAGSCYVACNSFCTDGTATTSWNGSCTTGGKNTQNCTSYTSTYRTCQNGQYYRTIVTKRNNVVQSQTAWGCSSNPRQ